MSRGTVPDDFHGHALAEPDVVTDQTMGQTVTVHGEHALGLLVVEDAGRPAVRCDIVGPGS